MTEENPYESPKSTNDAKSSSTKRNVRVLTGIASLFETLGWSMVLFGYLQIVDNKGFADLSIALGLTTATKIIYLGIALGILGIIVAIFAVWVWFAAKSPIAPLENELKTILDQNLRKKESLHG